VCHLAFGRTLKPSRGVANTGIYRLATPPSFLSSETLPSLYIFHHGFLRRLFPALITIYLPLFNRSYKIFCPYQAYALLDEETLELLGIRGAPLGGYGSWIILFLEAFSEYPCVRIDPI